MAPRWPKRAPRQAPERPKTGPRAPKSAPRAAQEGTKRRLFGPRRGYTNCSLLVFDRLPPSSVCLLPPVLVIGPRVAHLTVILAPFWPHIGAEGCNFLCDVNAFLALRSEIGVQVCLVVVSCLLVAAVHFCATSTHYHRIRVQIRDASGRSEG